MNQVIGILGGMGPRATVQFEQLLIDRLPGNDQELPTIVSVNDGRIPDRSNFLLGVGPDPVPRMQANLQTLEAAGASVICVPCNTACAPAILGRLRPKAQTRILDLPEMVAHHLNAQGIDQVVLLATTGTVRTGVYQDLCTARSIDCMVPNARIQSTIMRVIRLVKSGNLTQAKLAARSIQSFIAASQCRAVILGCTELPLVQDALVPDSHIAIDTLALLAGACVQYITATTKEQLT